MVGSAHDFVLNTSAVARVAGVGFAARTACGCRAVGASHRRRAVDGGASCASGGVRAFVGTRLLEQIEIASAAACNDEEKLRSVERKDGKGREKGVGVGRKEFHGSTVA